MRHVVRILAVLALFLTARTSLAETITVKEYSLRWAHYYADLNHVPRELVETVIEVESSWNPRAISRKGAGGLMQLMPPTATRFGVRDVFDIRENLRGGVSYVAFLMQLFPTDLRLVLAAYFAGECRILSRGLTYSSREVYQYVDKVLRIYTAKRSQTHAAALQSGSGGGINAPS